MSSLATKRLRFSADADVWLKVLKTRTGLTPNIICRLGFCLSLSEPGQPMAIAETDESPREINRYTLLGEYDGLFVALLKQRLKADGLPEEDMEQLFKNHMHRGISLMSSRVRSISDLAQLVPQLKERPEHLAH